MSHLNNSFDYNVKLLGLLPLRFDFSKDENIGVRYQTDKLKKVKKPSEDHHEGEMVSEAQLLQNSAVVEAKIIRHSNQKNTANRTDVSAEKDEDTSEADVKTNGESQDDIASSANESVQKLKIEDSRGDDVSECKDGDSETNDKQINQDRDSGENNDKNSESDSDDTAETSTEPVDKTMKEDLSVRFLYRSYYNVNGQQPDFLTYRLPLMFLAIKDDPYFFKVNKVRFKPYGCDNEMEFIQMQWPIQLNELYNHPKYDASTHKGWSGPTFNEWATKQEKTSSCAASASPSETASHGAEEKGEDNNDDTESNSTYHRAFIQAELKPKSGSDELGFSDSTRGFNIIITALVGGVWDLEEDPNDYTCMHLAEMRTVQEEILRETRSTRYSHHTDFFYKRVRMLSNYWQCYLAGETNYLVGVNGPVRDREPNEDAPKKRRQINELRLYDVAKIPDFIKKCGAEQGFRPWSKEILQNRLYKSLHVIYDTVKDAPVDTEFMFVKYNQFDPPIHDVDGSVTGPYLLAFRQLIIEGLPTPSQPQLVRNLMVLMRYAELVEDFFDRKFKREDVPKKEEKENCIVLTFQDENLQKLFLYRAGSMLERMSEMKKFPPDCGMENLSVKKVFMQKPVPQHGNNSQSWRSSNYQQRQATANNNNMQASPTADSTQSWRSSNHQQPQSSSRNYENNWRRGDSSGDNFPSWRSSNHQQRQPNLQNNNWRRKGGSANLREQSRNMDDSRSQRYGGRVNDDEQNWRRKSYRDN
ncbi:uncharacterized protein LOC119075189 [Bradysia coprophila]|uniref:uncharacterized protein LOC119075189 n=1 Tax=Bradysia coprophila TaxID=38358 RepID=UPI00187DB74B|nr:uncharacterized protein LOC119075189 [Bradysia coprophila]